MDVHSIRLGSANSYVVRCEKGFLLIDAGQPHHVDTFKQECSQMNIPVRSTMSYFKRPTEMAILTKEFYSGCTLLLGQKLLGKKLVRALGDDILSGIISEAEVYFGIDDSASHASKGMTRRNKIMFGPPGIAYVYFVYGMHYMLNIVTEKKGVPAAILIRSVIPVQGIRRMEILRGNKGRALTNGPAKLCQALAIDKSLNGWDVTRGETLWIEDFADIEPEFIESGPRVGVQYADRKDRDALRRFWINKECFHELTIA
ncbi:MAG: DNA-3-methyladenine glycosylase [Calditrichaeota bacterium]|nr:DNA-3-methyladenine glycosylase [Calditrichota bacterium]